MTKRILCQGILLGMLGLVAVGAACSKDSGGQDFDPNTCDACRADGQSCVLSDNCQPRSICNDPSQEYYSDTQPMGVCVKVACDTSAECEAPKTCGLEGVCVVPSCQLDSECPSGLRCIAGTCASAPSVADVDNCQIVTRARSIREGATIELSAIARNAGGAVLPAIEFDWTSSSPDVVALNGAVARGGAASGRSTITASVRGRQGLGCGELVLTNFAAVPDGQVRVVVVDASNGAAISGAEITLVAGGNTVAGASDADGAALIAAAAAAESITIIAPGYQYVTIFQPATRDLMVPVPKADNDAVAGGFRGRVDISSTRRADIQLGIAGPVIPPNLLDFSFVSLLGDGVKTVLDAPELGLNDQEVDLPGGVMLGLGNKRFTSDGMGLRCQGQTPAEGQLGCYLARAPEGLSAAWSAAGQLRISQVAGLAGTLKNVLGGDNEGAPLPIGDILTSVLPLIRTLNHGIVAAVPVTEHPKVTTEGGVAAGCEDPSIANYDDLCRGDYAKYSPVDIEVDQKFTVLSRVSVPNLPMLPNGECASAEIVISAAVLPGRGVLPLGLSAGVDVLKTGDAKDCKVTGVEKPFGTNSPDLEDGQIPLSMAPAHSGVEGSEVALIVAALDPNTLTTGVQLTALVERVESVREAQTISGSYLPLPRGKLNPSQASFRFDAEVTGATATRVEIQRGSRTWLVYAPGTQTNLALPNIPAARDVLGDVTGMFVQALKIDGAYNDMWTFGSGKTLDRVVENVEAFAVLECKGPTAPCTIAAAE